MTIARQLMLVAACLVQSVSSQAQASAPSLAGRSVRVTTTTPGLPKGGQAVIRSWDADSLRLETVGTAKYIAVPWSAVQKVEYKSGHTNSADKGAMIGLAVKRDRWADATPIPFQVTPTLQDGRPAISMAWRF